ncbi:calcineurin-like phosphoesterase C-terminal domain-containing protein [Gelidibacter maritimus]|uniref:Calcineurin-like phosphoesterase C-terminal domain-containing protein n=1 Tax=Gelidibacter maritimus TaxID=2761487 RepID=A0A7W2M490_9FLAO|nr:calcineurin-like phosphoesterase C-terminal domain-containing protein [Gelidibacter maritimus]MBA6152388.1 calcineurin-like phosphoesterase C-terminal domain-containing protein [Gelidibacter maritimus]
MDSIFKFLIICFLSLTTFSYAQNSAHWVSGNVVKYTKSLKKSRGLHNVMVSNGDTIVKTNRKGIFKIPIKPDQVIFPILPSGYKYVNPKKWWYKVPDSLDEASTFDITFGLQKVKKKKKFKFLAIGDIQVGTQVELAQATKSILQELLNRDDFDFSIYLGDLVNDSPELFQPLKRLIDDVPQQSWVVYGNHDRGFNGGQNQQPHQFREHFGSETQAYFYNDVLFISLNSITPKGKFGYTGIYQQKELRFLSHLLKTIDVKYPIVINQHIPLVWMKNKKEILDILDPFKNVLFLTGHSHTVFQNYIETSSGNIIHELTAGAVSGNWWTGQKDYEGIPLSLMSCGTPRGYFEIEFDKTDYKIKYKGVDLPESKQFNVWLGDRDDKPLASLSKNNTFFVNVFAGSNKTKVSITLPNGETLFLKKEYMVDPHVNYIKQSQREGNSPDKNSKKAPYLRKKSHHIWKGELPDTLSEGYHKMEIVIQDPQLATIRQSFWIHKE